MQLPRDEFEIDLLEALQDYLAGVEGSSDRLCRELRPILLPVARSRLSSSVWDPEDAVNTSLVAILKFLAERGHFEGGAQGLISFSSTVVRNRCLDIQRREARHPTRPLEKVDLPDEGEFLDPLKNLVAGEVKRNLRRSLELLEEPCRELLVSIFYHKKSMEELRESFGLKSVQALYYRRDKCLEKVRKILKTFD